MKPALLRLSLSVLVLILAIPAALIANQFIDHDDDAPVTSATPAAPAANTPEHTRQITRGAYLARAGNCMGCHTARGAAPYAGGRPIATPFGILYAPNITADQSTGLGNWSSQDFWRALHHGKSKDRRLLYPAFPYPNYTRITRADADALYAYLQTVPAVYQVNRPHALRFPYNQPVLLAAWRALYFSPATYRSDPSQSARWNRGAYLVQGPGHCSACHTARNALGATISQADLAGGLIPVLDWYAPSLTSAAEAGVGQWQLPHIEALLKTGTSPRGSVFGPMAEVVSASLQHLDDEDIHAIAVYLKSLPHTDAPAVFNSPQPDAATAKNLLQAGSKLYEQHCADCHRSDGNGISPAYPPLNGNRALTMGSAVNPVRMVLNGGFAPSTAGNPRPYGMPPFGPVLNDQQVAAVVSYIRNSWDNHAGLVAPQEVNRYREIPVE